MKKLIMVLSMVCMLGAIALGVMNKNFLETTLADLKQTKATIREVTEELGEKEDERDRLSDDESKAKDIRNMASAALDSSKQALKIEERKVDTKKENIEKIEIEQSELDLLVRRIFPDGNVKTPDELQMNLTMLEETLSTNETTINSLTMKVTELMSKQKVQISRVGNEEEHQLDRKVRLALGGLESTVIAVNPDWGFVIVNAGRNHGVEPDQSLLVKRGNVRIASLRLVNIQDNVSVCDVVKGSLVKGMNVDAGDKVIFENPFR